MNRRMVACGCLIVGLSSTAGWAQDDGADVQVRGAIRRGVQFLKSQQNPEGSWSYSGHDLGITALVGLALAENGVARDDPVLKSAHQFVQIAAPSNNQTYDISLAILFLVRIGDARDKELIRQLGMRLEAGQLSSGGWTYACPLQFAAGPAASLTNNPRNKPEPARRGGRLNAGPGGGGGPGFGDNSNTQFAVLGVWAAGRAGLDITDTMADVERRFRGTQSPAGGWAYQARGDADAMTCAGLMALALAKGQKTIEAQMSNRLPEKDKPEGPGGRPKMDSDKQIDAGIKRVEAYANGVGPGSSLYFLWSLERVGVALGLSRFGRVDWYGRGAAVLLQTQRPNGSWTGGASHGRGELTDTSFALLFLRRSNLTQGMPQLVSSHTGGSDDTKMRSGGLDDLIKTVRPPDKPSE